MEHPCHMERHYENGKEPATIQPYYPLRIVETYTKDHGVTCFTGVSRVCLVSKIKKGKTFTRNLNMSTFESNVM